MDRLARIKVRIRATLLVGAVISMPQVAFADDAKPFPQGDVGSIETPVVQTIDQNGVDLTNGALHLNSPLLTLGSGDDQIVFGLQWVGRSWSFINVPTVSRDGDKYFVSFEGQTYEFKNHDYDFEERKPAHGTSLECGLFEPEDVANFCIFVGRHGEVVHFTTTTAPLSPSADTLGYQTLGLGNIGMTNALVYDWMEDAPDPASPNPSVPTTLHMKYGGVNTPSPGSGFDQFYNRMNKRLSLGGQNLNIVTPNLDDEDDDDHYLLPDNTVQTIANDFGLTWKYHVNDDREIVEYEQPGGLAPIYYTYNGDHRVTSVQTADGTWDYNWEGASGNFRTVTVTAPGGRQVRVTSHKDLGYVSVYEEGALDSAAERQTTYTYNSDERMVQATYPEGNYDTFEYDARGNVTKKQSFPKSGSGDPVLIWLANYPAACTNHVLCNSPTSITDPEGRVTSFEYLTPGSVQIVPANGVSIETFAYGDPRPSVTHYPATASGEPQRWEAVQHYFGLVANSTTCISTDNCGTSDQIYTRYYYKPIAISGAVTADIGVGSYAGFRMTGGAFLQHLGQYVQTADGTRTTCSMIDEKGRVVATFPPSAGTGCPLSDATAQATNANPPEASGHTKSTPTYSQ